MSKFDGYCLCSVAAEVGARLDMGLQLLSTTEDFDWLNGNRTRYYAEFGEILRLVRKARLFKMDLVDA